MKESELTFRFASAIAQDKKGNYYDGSETVTENVSVTCPTELSVWAETRRRELGAILVNFNFVGE